MTGVREKTVRMFQARRAPKGYFLGQKRLGVASPARWSRLFLGAGPRAGDTGGRQTTGALYLATRGRGPKTGAFVAGF